MIRIFVSAGKLKKATYMYRRGLEFATSEKGASSSSSSSLSLLFQRAGINFFGVVHRLAHDV
jgi:hypothetical protein